MELVVTAAGVLTIAAAWRTIRVRAVSVWATMTPALVVVGIAAALVRPPVLASDVGAGTAALVGLGAGVALFAATRLFLLAAEGWTVLRSDARSIYGPTGDLPLGLVVLLAAISVVAEELFWRGLVQPRLELTLGEWGGAGLTWVLAVIANLPSGSVSIVLGATVGGATWAALAVWSGGIVAAAACHLLWTILMIVFPPPQAAGVR
ncbi:MAG: CPBP family intramembrane glutamic endopeptidase [Actinomycetota bacterium]